MRSRDGRSPAHQEYYQDEGQEVKRPQSDRKICVKPFGGGRHLERSKFRTDNIGFIKLEPRCLKRSSIVASVNPEPNWTLDDLMSELNSLESKLGHQTPSPLKQPQWPNWTLDDLPSELNSLESKLGYQTPPPLKQPQWLSESCGSEESDNESHINTSQCSLMHKNSLEGIIFHLEKEHLQKVKEQVRTSILTLKLYQQKKCEISQHVMITLEKMVEERREADRRLDRQYQRKIAEVLDNHLSAIRRDHEQRSQIEEASIEEAKQKEKALYEEKGKLEKVIAEAKAREEVAKLAEEQRLALEAKKESQRVAVEAAAKAAEHTSKASEEAKERAEGKLSSEESGIKVMAAAAALKAETNRIYENAGIPNIPQKDFERYGRKMFRIVSQITGTLEAVRYKANDIISKINDCVFPRSISTLIFAQKVVSICETPRGTDDRFIFACAHVILLVSSQVPSVMDFVLHELNKGCIYTIPKHLHPSNWIKAHPVCHLQRIKPYMKLYAAVIQTEIQGVRNPHGLEQGWAWLAMFLNALPPCRSTAFALDAFLRVAGFALFRRYKSQFMKVVDVISRSYLPALKRGDDQELGEIVSRLEGYLDDELYRKEPQGWRLEEHFLLSETNY